MAADAGAQQLGERNLSTIHAIAQALAIGPMFSVALVLSGVSNPGTGAGAKAALAVLIAGVGVLALGVALTLYAKRYAGAGAVSGRRHVAALALSSAQGGRGVPGFCPRKRRRADLRGDRHAAGRAAGAAPRHWTGRRSGARGSAHQVDHLKHNSK